MHWTPTPMPRGELWDRVVDVIGSGAQAPKLSEKFGITSTQLNYAFPGCHLYGK